MKHTGTWETDWTVISSEPSRDCLLSAMLLKTFTTDEIVTQFSVTQDQYPDKKAFEIQNVKILVITMQHELAWLTHLHFHDQYPSVL